MMPSETAPLWRAGQQHKEETIRDAEKAAIVEVKWGFDTVEIWNWETFKPDYQERLRTKLGFTERRLWLRINEQAARVAASATPASN